MTFIINSIPLSDSIFISNIDQLGRNVKLISLPKKIISTVPSQTELLFDLGLDDRIIGVTWFCIHPKEKCKTKAQIGGTKNLKIDKIRELQPDLIIANKEENEQSQIEELAKEFPVWISDIKTLEDSLEMIASIGQITNTNSKVLEIKTKIDSIFLNLPQSPPLRTVYLIWRNPWMSIGKDTFIHDMLTRCGLKNACAEMSRYPELSADDLKTLNPDLILLSSEPYPFKEKHIEELQQLLPNARIQLVDGENYSWYGTRLLHFRNEIF